MQINFESCVNHGVFIEQAKFLPHKDFEVIPINGTDIFDNSQTLKLGDKRSYLVKLKKKTEISIEDLLSYYKLGFTELGIMNLTWISNFGERNQFFTKTICYQYPINMMQVFTTKLINAPKSLILEEPIALTVKVLNVSPNAYKLRVYISDIETKSITINSISANEIPRALPFQGFDLQLLIYPKYKGIHKLAGIHLVDVSTNNDINLGILGEFLITNKLIS